MLNAYSEQLKRAVEQGNNKACYDACHAILAWGGVLGNQARLTGMKDFLADYLQKVRAFFNNNPSLALARGSRYIVQLEGGANVDIVMNSGFTKIYSLLCEKFIIYDGRVGAAFGLLVRKFLIENPQYGAVGVPDTLAFRYGAARNPNVNRNPSGDGFNFKALTNNWRQHTTNNLRANWIVDALALQNTPGFSDATQPHRAFEAALFMIGYRL